MQFIVEKGAAWKNDKDKKVLAKMAGHCRGPHTARANAMNAHTKAPNITYMQTSVCTLSTFIFALATHFCTRNLRCSLAISVMYLIWNALVAKQMCLGCCRVFFRSICVCNFHFRANNSCCWHKCDNNNWRWLCVSKSSKTLTKAAMDMTKNC